MMETPAGSSFRPDVLRRLLTAVGQTIDTLYGTASFSCLLTFPLPRGPDLCDYALETGRVTSGTMEAELESIAEEQSQKISFDADLSASDVNDAPLPQVTIQHIQDACKSLAEDPLLPEDFRQKCQDVNSQKLQEKLGFLNECLVPRGRFRTAAADKAWANFTPAFHEHKESVHEATKCEQVSGWVTLRVFKMLVAEAYARKEKAAETECPVREDEKGTLRYIGGCIVKKIKQRICRLLKNEFRDLQIVTLDALTCHSGEFEMAEGDMTALLDRGGLTHIKPEIATLFYSAEVTFRKLAGTGSVVKDSNEKEFVKACTENDDISSCFVKALNNCEMVIPTEVMESILAKILQLFFKIRIHHKMTTIMDKILFEENRAKKEKSMRKKLKMS